MLFHLVKVVEWGLRTLELELIYTGNIGISCEYE